LLTGIEDMRMFFGGHRNRPHGVANILQCDTSIAECKARRCQSFMMFPAHKLRALLNQVAMETCLEEFQICVFARFIFAKIKSDI